MKGHVVELLPADDKTGMNYNNYIFNDERRFL